MPKLFVAYGVSSMAMAAYFTQAAYAAIVSSPVVFAQATPAGESIFVTAMNYTGLGVVCLISLYMMREMGKDNRAQLKEMTEVFSTSLKYEREQRESMGKGIEAKVQQDHSLCRVDHKELMDTLDEIMRRLSECSNKRQCL